MLQEWIGRQQEARDEITGSAAQRMAALLDLPFRQYERGDAVPTGWYVILFAPLARQSELGPDGHPRKGQFLPPIPLPRRMFAGRRVWFHGALRIGDAMTRASRIERIEPKQGRSGEMCLVTVRHEISGPGGLAVVEEQDLIYREEPRPSVPRRESAAARQPGPAEWSHTVVPDPTMLFRYSAITFNAHRIHYDAAYTRADEGYPDLVVNGGLATLWLWQLAVARSGRAIKASASRNVKALYVNRPVTLCGRLIESGSKARMWALDADGELAIDAELELEQS